MRLGHEMTLHDASILQFGQFWRRSKRAGFAFAEGAAIHGTPPEHHFVRETRSALAWGAVVPLIFAILLGFSWLSFPAFVSLYLLQILRITAKSDPTRASFESAVLTVVGKFPEAQGALTYYIRRALGHSSEIIEYK